MYLLSDWWQPSPWQSGFGHLLLFSPPFRFSFRIEKLAASLPGPSDLQWPCVPGVLVSSESGTMDASCGKPHPGRRQCMVTFRRYSKKKRGFVYCKRRNFVLFRPKPFVRNLISYSQNDPQKKNRWDDRKACKPGGRKFGMEINFVHFSIIRTLRS